MANIKTNTFQDKNALISKFNTFTYNDDFISYSKCSLKNNFLKRFLNS